MVKASNVASRRCTSRDPSTGEMFKMTCRCVCVCVQLRGAGACMCARKREERGRKEGERERWERGRGAGALTAALRVCCAALVKALPLICVGWLLRAARVPGGGRVDASFRALRIRPCARQSNASSARSAESGGITSAG